MKSQLQKAIIIVIGFLVFAASTFAQNKPEEVVPEMGTAKNYQVIARKLITKGETTVAGRIALYEFSIIDFLTGVISGGVDNATEEALVAHEDLIAFYNAAWAKAPKPNTEYVITKSDLYSERTFLPGVYRILGEGSTVLDGELKLNLIEGGEYIFLIDGSLTIKENAKIEMLNANKSDVFWIAKGKIDVADDATMWGTNLVAYGTIDFRDGSELLGRAWSVDNSVQFRNAKLTLPVDLSVSTTVLPAIENKSPIVVGDEVIIKVVVKNSGLVSANSVQVVNALNLTGLKFGTATVSSGSPYNPENGTWYISRLAAGKKDSVTIKAVVERSGLIINTASVYGDVVEDATSNNVESKTICAVASDAGEISGPKELCIGGVYTYSVAAGSAYNTYNWKVPAGLKIVGDNNKSTIKVEVTATGGGAITVSVKDYCGVSPESKFNVSVTSGTPTQPGAISSNNKPTCFDSEVTYSIKALTGVTGYKWSVPAGWDIISDNGISITIKATANAKAGQLSVHAYNTCGDGPARSIAIAPVVTTLPAPGAISGPAKVCATAASAEYNITAVTGATEYIWAVPQGWAIISGQGTTKIIVKPSAQAGNITVKAKNTCVESEARSFAVTPTLTAPLQAGAITGTSTVCASTKGLTYTIAKVEGATGYTWTVPQGWTITAGQNTLSITVTAGTSNGKVTVEALNDCGANGKSELPVYTTASAPAKPAAITGSKLVCDTKTATYSITSIAGATSYEWVVPQGWTITSDASSSSITVKVGTNAGEVKVRALNTCGASEYTTLNVAIDRELPAAPAKITGPAEVCRDTPGFEYSIEGVATASSYVWTVPSGWAITKGQGTSKITVKSSATEGDITVAAVNACGMGAAIVLPVKVVPSPPAKPETITGPATVCAGQQDVVYKVTPVNGATSYIWTVPGWEIIEGQGTTEIKVKAGSANTTVSVAAVNACGVTGDIQMASVVTSATPAKPGKIAGETLNCSSKTATYSIAAVAGATSYNWILPQGWTITSGAGTTSITVTVGSNTGAVSVQAVNACGAGEASSVNVTVARELPAAPAKIAGPAEVCRDSEGFVYSVEGAASSYVWTVPAGWVITSGQGTNKITVKSSATEGKITVAAVNACGQGAAVELPVKVVPSPPAKPEAITGPASVCAGQQEITYTIKPVAGATSYVWSAPGWTITSGQGTNTITVMAGAANTTISVAAVNACGVTGAAQMTSVVTTAAPAKPGAIAGEPLSCATKELTYSITPVAGATNYTWSVPATWEVISGQGTTNVKVKVGNGTGEVSVIAENTCGTSLPSILAITSTNEEITEIAAIAGEESLCAGSTTTYAVAETANVKTYTWEIPQGWEIVAGQGTREITVKVGSASGSVRVTAANDCSSAAASKEVTIAAGAPAAPGAIKGNATVCVGRVLTLSVDPVQGATTYNWALPQGWIIEAGQGTTTITVVAGESAGEAQVVASNSCGVSAPSSANLTSSKLATTTGYITDLSSPCAGLAYEVAPVEGAITYNWSVPTGWVITSGQGTNRITVTPGDMDGIIKVVADNGVCSAEEASILSDKDKAGSVISVPNVFSPNNDGNYDTWQIANIENFKDNDLSILNRWGNEVYRAKGYSNGWDGNGLAEGTYFYVLRVTQCDGKDAMYKGYVTIVR